MSHQTHPFINIVCKRLDEINDYLTINPVYALKEMDHLLRIVDPDKRETTADYGKLLHDVQAYSKEIAAIGSPMEMTLRMKLDDYNAYHSADYVNLYDRLWGIMWKCGYMFDATFRVEIKEDKPVG